MNSNNLIQRILIVDDNEMVVDTLSELFKTTGFEVTQSINASSAIEKMKLISFDFLLTDIEMPQLNGIELAKVTQIVWPNIFVFLMTGNPQFVNKENAVKLGVEEIFLKSGNIEDILQRISSYPKLKKIS